MRNKAERLAVAGTVAPHLRDASTRTRMRRVALVDKDGNVTGYTSLADVQRSILERAKIEIDVADGVRPEKVICETCGKPATYPPKARLRLCKPCKKERKKEQERILKSTPEWREKDRIRSRAENMKPEQLAKRRAASLRKYYRASEEQIAKDRKRWLEKQKKKLRKETPEEREARLAYQREWYARNREEHKRRVIERYWEKKNGENRPASEAAE